jgi:hypothetical protein
MTTCKRIITPDKICSESALDSVCKLVVQGWKVQTACKFVAEEYQRDYPEDKADSRALRLLYYRANPKKKTTKKVYHDTLSTIEKPLVFLNVPMVDSTILLLIQEHNQYVKELLEAVKVDSDKFINRIYELEEELKLYKKDVIVPAVVEKLNVGIAREKVSDFILKYGEGMQCRAVERKDSLSNKELFGIFCVVRERYKASIPPSAWDKNIIEAEYIDG